MARIWLLSMLLALMPLPGLAAALPCQATLHEGEQPHTVALQGLSCQLRSHRLLLVGELHGTVETPALLAALLRDQPASRPLRVGLEWPVELQRKVDTYFRSHGT